MGYFDGAMGKAEVSVYAQNELYHHGVLGQKWGVRRFQNENGTLTAAGKKRYGDKVEIGKDGTYKTHKDYKTANKFAKASYKQRKEQIKEEWRNDQESGRTLRAIGKRLDNRAQYNYELNRNRMKATRAEAKADIAKGAAKGAASAAAVAGAAIIGGKVMAGYMNRKYGTADSTYEYKVGKAKVAKYVAKAAAVGTVIGAVSSVNKSATAINNVRNTNKKSMDRAKRAAADEKRWKEGKI